MERPTVSVKFMLKFMLKSIAGESKGAATLAVLQTVQLCIH
jgi:hypothetical protein